MAATQGVYRHAEPRDRHRHDLLGLRAAAGRGGATCPVVWYLSGLTCTHANVTEKGEYRRACAELGLIFVAPDTSPRGPDVPDDEAYDFGQGAGFYVDATQAPFDRQLPDVFLRHRGAAGAGRRPFPGRHGAAGRSPAIRWAATARSPSRCAIPAATAASPPSRRSSRRRRCRGARRRSAAISGDDRAAWRGHDAVALIEDGARVDELLVDQGEADAFLAEQLQARAARSGLRGGRHPADSAHAAGLRPQLLFHLDLHGRSPALARRAAQPMIPASRRAPRSAPAS